MRWFGTPSRKARPGVTGKPVVGLMPGGVSGSGKGVALCPSEGAPCAGDDGSPLRRADGRRFALVERNPVVPAPEPGALVKLWDCVSGLLALGARAGRARVAPRGAARRLEARIRIGVLESRPKALPCCRRLRVRECRREHGGACARQRKTMWNGTPHENILAPQARLMVNGCKTRMVNGALRSPFPPFPC